MEKLRFRTAEQAREKLDKKQRKEIIQLYKDMAKDIEKELKKLAGKTNISSVMRDNYLRGLQKELNTILANNGDTVKASTLEAMTNVAKAITEDNAKWLTRIGLPPSSKLFRIPQQVVETVSSGKLYDGNWTLSRAIWKDINKNQSTLDRIIAKGIAENKSSYDIAKDLEQWVNPNKRLPWDWSKVYPNSSKTIDYNAQRLARTCVSHAYEEAFIRNTEANPFVLKYQWQASSANPCPLCMDRDGEYYTKGNLPLDHPNGKCTFIAVIEDEDAIIDRIANWANGNTDPELDEFASLLR